VSTIGPLLEVQKLDLAADRLREKRATLPERSALVDIEAAIAQLDRDHEAARARREELARAEREVGAEVASIAGKAKEVETTLYSGTVTIAKELGVLQQELEIFKRKQEEAEERELALLEQIETADAALAESLEQRGKAEATGGELRTRIAAAEGAIDDELLALEASIVELRSGLPAQVLATYDRLRSSPRLAGRAAVALGSGMCEGCRLDLPVMEYRRVRDEPEDAVVCCVHCSRMLIR
jgi:predicted  nucleic acid-binding Zn-ribbon protein